MMTKQKRHIAISIIAATPQDRFKIFLLEAESVSERTRIQIGRNVQPLLNHMIIRLLDRIICSVTMANSYDETDRTFASTQVHARRKRNVFKTATLLSIFIHRHHHQTSRDNLRHHYHHHLMGGPKSKAQEDRHVQRKRLKDSLRKCDICVIRCKQKHLCL